MNIDIPKLKELLIGLDYIKEADFDLLVKDSEKENKAIEDLLVERDFIKDKELGKIIAEDSGFKFIDLRGEKISLELLALIPQLVASSNGVIAISRDEKGVKVGMRDPDDIQLRHMLEKRIGQKVIPYYVTKRGMEEIILQYGSGLQDEFGKILRRIQDPSLSREEKDGAVIKMVNMLLLYGYNNKASDIHIEPYKDRMNIRFRIDGIMHDVLEVPKAFSDLIVTLIKIMGKMRTDEHRAAQDGKFQFLVEGENVDVRVSILPVVEGENVVMRILSSKGREFSLSEIGLSDDDLKKVNSAIKKPHGMILVTGPTGSGKTTTLYSIIKILNKRDVHISTIEDPIEYEIEGISQIQVNSRADLTFAKGLRSIVRQDPDIMMVGEIRDEETADIAVNSAMTGHLVLSTLHANDSATTLPRLLDMKIEPFLITSTVNIVIAQRLVRKICTKCIASREIDDEERKMIKEDPELEKIFKKYGYKKKSKLLMFKGTGCKSCSDTGYSGRIGIFEALEMTEGIAKLVLNKGNSGEIMKLARKEGMSTMLEDGVSKIFKGVTTLEEVLRVTKT